MSHKVLYVGCGVALCPHNIKGEKCNRNVVMLNDAGQCKIFTDKIDKKSWWKFW